MVSALVRLCVVVVVFIGCITQTCARWPTQAANPGFKARITKNGLKFINDVGVGMLAKDVPGETIPDISGTADISIGKVDYTVSSMSIRSFNVPVTSLTTQQGVGLSFKASGGAISLHGDWRYKYKKGFIHISDHGNFDATVNGLNINLDIGLGKDSTGHPSITSTHCSGSISSISITFHGGASWLYNLFSSSIENTLKKSLNGKICDIITKEIEDHAKPSLANLKLVTDVGPYTELDYSLVDNPMFQVDFMETSHKGEFYPKGQRKEVPFSPPAFTATNATNKMVYMWATDYVINSGGYVFQEIGKLVYNITDDMVPAMAPFHLNTSSLGVLIPQLKKQYPNRLMVLMISSTKAPRVSLAPNKLTGNLWADLVTYVIQPDGTLKYVFTLETVVGGSGEVGFNASKITGHVTKLSAKLSLKDSVIGQFDVDRLQGPLQLLITFGAIPYLNTKGAEGFPIPDLDGVDFIDPEITVEKDVIKIGTNLNYNPTSP